MEAQRGASIYKCPGDLQREARDLPDEQEEAGGEEMFLSPVWSHLVCRDDFPVPVRAQDEWKMSPGEQAFLKVSHVPGTGIEHKVSHTQSWP